MPKFKPPLLFRNGKNVVVTNEEVAQKSVTGA
ncbi:hypothetical protein EYZ11_013360 [Aspergillus tanneri]|uniref:Uncharacterized protein n=1 Tax=Aspergillus tanneri TaxID=1220188 RepID=A0A4S3IYD6_9EURO|nr:hypothetical protein EYZ11_013360 [Aspergillus tanneri]